VPAQSGGEKVPETRRRLTRWICEGTKDLAFGPDPASPCAGSETIHGAWRQRRAPHTYYLISKKKTPRIKEGR